MNNNASIILQRLVIRKGTKSVYDEQYHKGVNIIRSDGNSKGKSTIMDFIFFLLGGDVDSWTEEASSCDEVRGEIVFSNVTYTLKRSLEGRFPPISFFEGNYNESIQTTDKWLKFSNRRSIERESYSQAIFRLLNYPEKKLSNFSNITIHELLRLIYSDQLTSVNQIFRHQQFDSDEMKQTLGEFLLGIDDLELHRLRLKLRDDEKELSQISGQISATDEIFKTANLKPSEKSLNTEIRKLEEKQIMLIAKVERLESGVDEIKSIDIQRKIEVLRKDLNKIEYEIRDRKDIIEESKYENEDSLQFIESLKSKLTNLSQSEVIRETLGDLKFEFCPACLSKIDESNEVDVCHLCKEKIMDEEKNTGSLRMQYELNFQIQESEELFEIRKIEIEKVKNELSKLRRQHNRIYQQLQSYLGAINPITQELRVAYEEIGMINQEIENLHEKRGLITILRVLQEKKIELKMGVQQLKDKILILESEREARNRKVRKRISEITLDILHRDIQSEESFSEAESFIFDFRKNKLSVDGKIKFSASSTCFLKSAFLFSIFLVSIEDELTLFPRFALHDNLEDKGATPERVQNLHNIMLDYLQDLETDHQLIFTTSVLSPSLEGSEYCVGPLYDYDNKTLSL